MLPPPAPRALSPGDVHARAKLSVGDLKVSRRGATRLHVGSALVRPRPHRPACSRSGSRAARHRACRRVDRRGSLSPGDVQARAKLSVGDLNVGAAGPQGYTLGLRSFDLDLTDLLARGAVPVQHGTEPAAASSGDVKVAGRLGFADLRLAGADAKTFAVGARAFELPFQEIALPGVLARGASAGSHASDACGAGRRSLERTERAHHTHRRWACATQLLRRATSCRGDATPCRDRGSRRQPPPLRHRRRASRSPWIRSDSPMGTLRWSIGR